MAAQNRRGPPQRDADGDPQNAMLGGLHSSDSTSLANLKAIPSRATLSRRWPRLRVNRLSGRWIDDASGAKGDDFAIRLAAAGEALGLAEGVETGLSAMKLFDVPVWCVLGAARMHSVFVPDNVRELHLFADADEAGQAAVERALEVHRRRRVMVHRPLSPGEDFNDALRALEKECAA